MRRIGTGSIVELKGTVTGGVIDVSTADVFSVTVAAPITFSFTNPAPSGMVSSFILEITNGGAYAITWPTVKWASAVVPSLTSSGKDVLGFYTYDGGTTWNGTFIAKDVR